MDQAFDLRKRNFIRFEELGMPPSPQNAPHVRQLADLAVEWNSQIPMVQSSAVEQSFKRLDARYDWLPSVTSLPPSVQLANMPSDCSQTVPSVMLFV